MRVSSDVRSRSLDSRGLALLLRYRIMPIKDAVQLAADRITGPEDSASMIAVERCKQGSCPGEASVELD